MGISGPHSERVLLQWGMTKRQFWFVAFVLSVLGSGLAYAQQKMDLDDVAIKGELHSDDRLRILAREKNRLKNYVKYRTNYRAEMIQGLPRPKPIYHYDSEPHQ